ncbi:MAG: helix-turn-helix transcriptional regulator [Ktedonobacterales bacterium]|nr:helix-turn-helix transcriptional regulator [Ktedonobacterales bacterium]
MNEADKGASWQDFTDLKGMLRALGDIARLNLVRVLASSGEVNVTDLAQALLISQPLVSWHLSALRRHGLVRTRRQGRQVYCSLNLERYRECLRLLGAVIGQAPAAVPAEDAATAARPPRPEASARSHAPTSR